MLMLGRVGNVTSADQLCGGQKVECRLLVLQSVDNSENGELR